MGQGKVTKVSLGGRSDIQHDHWASIDYVRGNIGDPTIGQ